MIKIGLTGGFGSGKTLVSNFLKASGIPVIDADNVARFVVEHKSPTLKDIQKYFGDHIIAKDGSLNRLKLADIVFKNEEARRQLNKIIHPAILKQIDQEIRKLKEQGATLVVIDAPLLFETSLEKKMDTIITVWAPEDICRERLIKQRGFSLEEVTLRMKSQWPLGDKKQRADYVIDNSGNPEDTQKQSLAVINRIRTSLCPSP